MRRHTWRDGIHREILPIDAYLSETMRLLEENQVLVIEAETGAGKTTRIPQAILTEWPDTKVVVTQPRRPAVRWAARYIAKEMRDVPGGIIGWKLFGEKPMVSQDTRCVFQIDQSLANRIRRTGKLPKGVIIVDEAHERHISTDTLLILLERLLPESPETKLIVTSATIDTKKFSDYFSGAPILSISGRCYPVETLRRHLIPYEHHSSGAVKAGGEVISQFLNWGQLLIQDKENPGANVVVESGTILIFLPGKEDIDNALRQLTQHVDGLRESGYSVSVITNGKKTADTEYKIEIFPCHAELSPVEQDRTQANDVPEKTLRIICTTDIARGSATFPQVVGVIDSLQVKRRFVDEKGASHLGKISVSKAEADQAKGRAGRTQPGFYIPIGSEYDVLNRWPMPAILREPLTAVILQLIAGGINPRDCHYIDAPKEEMIAVTIERLKKLGALDKTEAITETGELLVQFPIDPENAKTLITADRLGVLSEAVIAAACLDNDGIFFLPRKDGEVTVDKWVVQYLLLKTENYYHYSLVNLPEWVQKDDNESYTLDPLEYEFPLYYGSREVADIVRRSWSDSQSDFAAMVEAFRAFKNFEFDLRARGLDYRQINDELFNWCKRNFLNFKKMRLVESTINQIKEEINASPLQFKNRIYEERSFDSDSLSKAIASGLIDNIGTLQSGQNYSSHKGEFAKAHNSVCPNEELILIGGVRKVPVRGRRGRTYHILLADLASPLKPEWLEEIMPQFCSYETGLNPCYDMEKDSVVSTTQVYCNGQFIGGRIVDDSDNSEAAEIFANWLSTQYGHSNPMLNAITKTNWRIARRAERLNQIAGEKRLFQEWDKEKFKVYFLEKLAGARSVSEINNFQNLLIPVNDLETANLITSENPEEIEILGYLRKVEYMLGSAPRVKIPFEAVNDVWSIETHLPLWTEIPDEGYQLPGERKINLHLEVRGYYDISGLNGEEVKDKILALLNGDQFEKWSSERRPEIKAPNPDDESEKMPEIVTAEYGRCVIYNTPLIAFGSVYDRSMYSRSLEISQEAKWFQALAEAEKARSHAVERLEKYRSELRKKRALEAIIIPDLSQEDAVIPEIADIEGGYGVVIVNSSRYYGSDPWFKIYWTQSRDDAERYHESAVKKLEEVKAEEIKKRDLQDAKAEAEVAKSKAGELYYHSDNSRLGWDLRDKLSGVYYGHIPSVLEELKSWIAKARKNCAQVESAYAEIQRRRDERKVQIPERLLEKKAFDGDEDLAHEFMLKVMALPTELLDEHIVCSCGREKVRHHLIEVSGDQDFFLHADPNAVRFYVADYHYYSKEGNDNADDKIGTFGEALQKAMEEVEIEPDESETDPEAIDDDVHVQFEDLGRRHFRCPQGHTLRITKSEWKTYQAGEAIQLACSVCEVSGEIQKAVEAEEKSETENGKLDLSGLKEAWGAH